MVTDTTRRKCRRRMVGKGDQRGYSRTVGSLRLLVRGIDRASPRR